MDFDFDDLRDYDIFFNEESDYYDNGYGQGCDRYYNNVPSNHNHKRKRKKAKRGNGGNNNGNIKNNNNNSNNNKISRRRRRKEASAEIAKLVEQGPPGFWSILLGDEFCSKVKAKLKKIFKK